MSDQGYGRVVDQRTSVNGGGASVVIHAQARERQGACARLDDVRTLDDSGIRTIRDRERLGGIDADGARTIQGRDGRVLEEVLRTRARTDIDVGGTREAGGTRTVETRREGRRARGVREVQRGVIGHLTGQGDGGGERQLASIDGRGTGVVIHAQARERQVGSAGLDDGTGTRNGSGEGVVGKRQALAAGDRKGSGAGDVKDARIIAEVRRAITRAILNRSGAREVGRAVAGQGSCDVCRAADCGGSGISEISSPHIRIQISYGVIAQGRGDHIPDDMDRAQVIGDSSAGVGSADGRGTAIVRKISPRNIPTDGDITRQIVFDLSNRRISVEVGRGLIAQVRSSHIADDVSRAAVRVDVSTDVASIDGGSTAYISRGRDRGVIGNVRRATISEAVDERGRPGEGREIQDGATGNGDGTRKVHRSMIEDEGAVVDAGRSSVVIDVCSRKRKGVATLFLKATAAGDGGRRAAVFHREIDALNKNRAAAVEAIDAVIGVDFDGTVAAARVRGAAAIEDGPTETAERGDITRSFEIGISRIDVRRGDVRRASECRGAVSDDVQLG